MTSPAKLSVQTVDGPKVDGQYIVMLKPDCDKVKELARLRDELDANSCILHDYDASCLNGFAAKLTPNVLELLKQHDGVDSIYEDSCTTIDWDPADDNVTAMEDAGKDHPPVSESPADVEDSVVTLRAVTTVTQRNATWGLQRINQRQSVSGSPSALGFTFTYDSRAGNGVDIYVLDTGVRTTHRDFGGRARFGFSAIDGQTQDDNGHGTHVAGTCIGSRFGVAKRANVISVKIADRDGVISTSNALAGLTYTFAEASVSRRPAIANASWGLAASPPLRDAITRMIGVGIHIVAAAGNSNMNAQSIMPAAVPGVTTMAASTIQDVRWADSNWGPVVDLFAPGHQIISASNRGDNQQVSKSGTSFAAPHATGVAAILLSMAGNTNPATLHDMLRNRLAANGVLGGGLNNTRNSLLQSR